MSNCIDYNCNDLEIHLMNDCAEELLGGQDQVILLDCDHTVTDPSDGASILANISAGTAFLVQNVKVGLDAPSPIEQDSNIANRPSKLVNYDRTLSYVDGNINNHNVNTFYPSWLTGRALGGMIVYENGNDTKAVTWIDAPIYATGGRILPPDNNEFQRVEVVGKWKSKTDPKRYNAPTGVFA